MTAVALVKYRPDIDGLRAIAVLSIVFYHLDIPPFSGGFVGVDIFFVISGYLITSIILRELAQERFSLARFYERRARRILPALIVVVATTLVVGYLMLSPANLKELAWSAAASLLFSSNVLFFFESGYFDSASELKPLLHTWSLAVEEQFYILFPFLLLLISRHGGKRFLLWLVALFAASVAACIVVTVNYTMAAFYLIPFRSWELMIGAILALQVLPSLPGRVARNRLALVGLAMILVSVIAFTHDTVFPGSAALVPTLGTAIVIYARTSGDTGVNRMLGNRAMVFIGLISYSLYLWHWPVAVFAKHYLINEFTDAEKAVLLGAMFVLATLSWRIVETPFRDRRRFGPRPRLFAGFATICSALVVTSLTIIQLQGFPGRGTPADWSASIADDPGWDTWKACEEQGEREAGRLVLCRVGRQDVPATFLFWGDSHAMALASAVNLSALRQQRSGMLAIRTGCPPLLGIDRPNRTSCAEFNDRVLRLVLDSGQVDTVILAARWALSTSGERYKTETGSSVRLVDVDTDRSDGGNEALFATGLRRTVEKLQTAGKRVIIVKQVPEVGYDVPSANYAAKMTGRDVNELIAPTVAEYLARTGPAHRVIDALAGAGHAGIVDPANSLCDGGRCAVAIDGTPLYRDHDHLSLRGSILIASLFDPVIGAGSP